MRSKAGLLALQAAVVLLFKANFSFASLLDHALSSCHGQPHNLLAPVGRINQDATTTTLVVLADDQTAAGNRFCAGRTHYIQVSYTLDDGLPDSRWGVLAASEGALRWPGTSEAASAGRPLAAGCGTWLSLSSHPTGTRTSQRSSGPLPEYLVALRLPCTAAGEVRLASYSARKQCDAGPCTGDNPVHVATLVLAVDPSCAAAACIGDSAAAAGAAGASAAAGSAAAAVNLAALQQAGASRVVVAAASSSKGETGDVSGGAVARLLANVAGSPNMQSVSSNTGACPNSGLGYACSSTLGKVTVHWTIGGLAPPNNLCTGPDAASKPLLTQADLGSTQLIHYAVEGPSTGYVALGFGHNNQDMDPTDIVLGWAAASGQGAIKVYHVTQTDISVDDAYPDGQLYGASVMQDGTARTITCFSRKADDPRWEESPQMDLTTADWNFVWALDNSDGLEQHRSGNYGGGSINGLTGSTTSVSAGDKEKAIRAHGILMAVAWALLLPLGTLLPAHRWVLGGWLWRGKAMWFWLHQFFQLTGLACFLAGLVIAFVEFPDPEGSITKSHAYIGYTIIGMAGLQLCSGYARPEPTHHLRPMWNLFHINWGRITVLLAWANVFIGIVAFHQGVYGEQISPWAGPIAACMAFMLGVDLALRMVRPTAHDAKGAFVAMGSLVRGGKIPPPPAPGAGGSTGGGFRLPTLPRVRTSGHGSMLAHNGSITTVNADGGVSTYANFDNPAASAMTPVVDSTYDNPLAIAGLRFGGASRGAGPSASAGTAAGPGGVDIAGGSMSAGAAAP